MRCYRSTILAPSHLLTIFILAIIASCSAIAPATAQDSNPLDGIDEHVAAGEYTLALQEAAQMPDGLRDQAYRQIAQSQALSGAAYGAIQSAGSIQDDSLRNQALDSVFQSGDSQRGGITAADFDDLIQLIQNTIEPETWDQDTSSIRAYPAGVYVDSTGVLQRLRTDTQIDWSELQTRSTADSGNRDVDRSTPLRKISLTRLARYLERQAVLGKTPDPIVRHLAGMYRIEHVLLDRDNGEIIIAGPAGAMKMAPDGHWVNAETGQSVLLLDDFVECLRNAWESGGKFGCSIDPRQENLARTSEYLATTRLTNRAFRDGLRDALGLQDINVFGIDPHSHAAQILVEADYRMKCIGLGVEESIAEVPSYWDRLDFESGQAPPSLGIARWWFTMNYDAIVANPDRTIYAIRGQGVKVLSEDELLARNGQRVHTGQSTGATRSYAEDFTRHFDKLCAAKPCFAELRNVFDMALVGAIVADQIRSQRIDRSIEYLCTTGSADSMQFVYQTQSLPQAKSVESVMNHQYYESRNNGRRQRHMVVAVGGGVEFDAQSVLKETTIADDGSLEQAVDAAQDAPAEWVQWWWD